LIIRVLYINIFLLLISGCSAKYNSELNTIEKHTIHSSELRMLMNELDMVVYDRYKSELERDDTRRRYALNLAQNIEKISKQINNLSKDKLAKNIDKNDISLFSKYVKELSTKGKNIRKLALNYELENIDKKIENIELTCNACHSKFRSYL